MTQDFHYTLEDGIAIIIWDQPHRSMNVMTSEAFATLDEMMTHALDDAHVRGIILTSGKADFAAGMDLAEVAQMKTQGPRAIFDAVMKMHAILRRIERAGMDPATRQGGKPVAAVLPGTGLGIGLELPLACHRIFVKDREDARIGLPEIKVGLFPGGGGTTRLVRKLGLMAAAPVLLEGRIMTPKAAQKAGLIDEVCADPMQAARDWIAQAAPDDLVKPWDKPGWSMPGGAPYSAQGFMTFAGASAMINARTKGAYMAPKALISAVYEGALVPFDLALKIEARWFTHVVCHPQSGAMINTLFVNKSALEKGARRPDLPAQPTAHLGIIGAGMMGAGIALGAARAGITVTLLDLDAARTEQGKGYCAGFYDKAIKRGTATPAQKADVLDRITTTTDMDTLCRCDMVIEAVFEDPEIKANVLAQAARILPDMAVLATNTSSLPITGLAQACKDPARFVGIHFFSPAETMPLVEIITTARTDPATVARAFDLARQMRKTPIIVSDARFFYANRCITPYLNEGLRLLEEGASPALIENAAVMLGMPLGPLQLIDEVSLDLAAGIAKATRAAQGADYADHTAEAVVGAMIAQDRHGRKSGAGFYQYDADGKRQALWPGLGQLFARRADPPLEEVQNRLLLIQTLEAVRAFEAGVIHDIREADVGAILGWGFAPWSGGPFSWIDMVGVDRVVAMTEDLAVRCGPRFGVPPLLARMKADGRRFYQSGGTPVAH
ncbi:3-hydroxyacyl-CoA dehydrogenase [Rhodobacteraceae bacterium]|nr:3-hydroxyacyl-CoA dehydrogenase [Paracoccaceae bacterium]